MIYGKCIIYCTIFDEGTSTCVMSLSCWKVIGSPKLVAPSMMFKDFDTHLFKPHRIILTIPIKLRGGES